PHCMGYAAATPFKLTLLVRMISEPSSAPSPQVQAPASDQQVSWREKLAYGVGGIPLCFAAIGLKGLAIPVYQMTLKVDPLLLGTVLALPRFLDAVTTPIA